MKARLSLVLALVLLLQAVVFAVPSARAEASVSLTGLVAESGRSTISWSVEGEEAPPYRILYRLADTSAKQALCVAGETDGHSFVTADLLPGRKYQVYITDSTYLVLASKTYIMPTRTDFSYGRLKSASVKVQVQPRSLKAGGDLAKDTEILRNLPATGILKRLFSGEEDTYGFRYVIRFPKQKDAEPFVVTIAIESPDGFTGIAVAGEYAFDRVVDGNQVLTFYLLGNAFFRDLYAVTGKIPAGTYTVRLYLNGMFTNASSFDVV